MSGPAAKGIKGQRFRGRFLGGPLTWLWLAGTGVPAVIGWYLVAVPARGTPGDQRSWFLWSGNLLLALFVLTVLFSARKWSIKLPFFRDYGRGPRHLADRAWTSIQDLNRNIREGKYANDDAILKEAAEILRRNEMEKTQQVDIRTAGSGASAVKFVALRKRQPFGRLETWLEMHMGVGIVACLAVFLHADVMPGGGSLWHHVGWTLLIGSMIVLVTGVLGAVLYRVLPPSLADADPGIPYEEAGVARENYDACLDGLLGTLDEDLRAQLAPLRARAGSVDERRKRNGEVLSKVATAHPEHAALVRDLAVMAGSRDYLLWSTARARRLDRLLKFWKWIHIPVSVALFFVIALHVLQVVWY